jgi:hypothetical protein
MTTTAEEGLLSRAERRRRKTRRSQTLRASVRYLLTAGTLRRGAQTLLARHFGVSRQRVHQIVVDERERLRARAAIGR